MPSQQKGHRMPRLIRIDWPDSGQPAIPPALTLDEGLARLAALRQAGERRGLGAIVIYGDREHFANIHWATGVDPRFEEALLVLTRDRATLLLGNECLPYAEISPLVTAGRVETLLVPSLSLVSQPRKGIRIPDALADLIPAGAKVGTIGWKYFGPDEFDDPATALDLPVFLADPLRRIAGRVENAADILMHPVHGLRARVDAAGIARLEFANHMAARAVTRLAFALREGATDFDVFAAAHAGGLPYGCHPTFASGGVQGMSSPTGQRLRRGDPVSFNICHWGSNTCRAGWLAASAEDLPVPARDYLDVFAYPYVRAMSLWCAMMTPGMIGGEVWSRMMAALPAETFGVTLNPGHLIATEEWMSSPISEGSDMRLASGMAMQMDVIPGHPVYGSTRMEDGYVIADTGLRADLAATFPDVSARVARRQAFMRDVIGMEVPDTLLPLADTCGIVAPFLLDPGQVISLR
jgi:Xaa-Pro aminopeptidase